MRPWSSRVKYEDRNRAAGICTRSKQHGALDPHSKNLCPACLTNARLMRRAAKAAEKQRMARLALIKKPAQRVERWEWMKIA